MVSRCLRGQWHRSGSLAIRAVELSLSRAPRQRTHERVVVQVVPPLKESIAEVMQFTPLERGPDGIAKRFGQCPGIGRHSRCATVAMCGRDSRGGIGPTLTSATAVSVDATMLCVLEETVEVGRSVPHERMQLRIVDVPVSQVLEKMVEVVKLSTWTSATTDHRANCGWALISGGESRGGEVIPPEEVRWIDEQIVDMLVPQIGKISLRWWSWSHEHACSNGLASNLWRCLFHKSRRTVSKSSKLDHRSIFRKGSVNRSWSSPFHKLTRRMSCSEWKTDCLTSGIRQCLRTRRNSQKCASPWPGWPIWLKVEMLLFSTCCVERVCAVLLRPGMWVARRSHAQHVKITPKKWGCFADFYEPKKSNQARESLTLCFAFMTRAWQTTWR